MFTSARQGPASSLIQLDAPMKSRNTGSEETSGCFWSTLLLDQLLTKSPLLRIWENIWQEGFFFKNLLKRSVIVIETFFMGT